MGNQLSTSDVVGVLEAVIAYLKGLQASPTVFDDTAEIVPLKKSAAPTKKAKAPVEEEEEQQTFDMPEEIESEEHETVTKEDLLKACSLNRDKAIKILKSMKVKSVHDVKPAHYSKIMSELGL